VALDSLVGVAVITIVVFLARAIGVL